MRESVCVCRWDGTPDMTSLLDVVRHVKPHALFGLTGAGPAFTQEIVEEMCQHTQRPIIFPLSNPTSQAEISAENAYNWSKGKCLFAAGSPFDPVEYDGTTFYPGQANNVFIFPGKVSEICVGRERALGVQVLVLELSLSSLRK